MSNKNQQSLAQTIVSDPEAPLDQPVGLIPGLSDDIAIHVLARIPRRYYSCLRLVSKTWQASLEGFHLYEEREKLGFAEPWLYVLTGQPQEAPFKVYDPVIDAWHRLPPMPRQSQDADLTGFACAAVGRRLLVMGGISKGEVTAEVQAYCPMTNRWSPAAPMTTARSWHACGVIGDRVYVAGGQGKAQFLSSAEVYHSQEDRWEPVASMSVARSSHSRAVMGGEFWVIAGEFERHDWNRTPRHLMRGSAEAFHPEKGVWRQIPDMWPDWHKVPSPSAVIGGELYAAHHGKIQAYSPITGQWKQCGSVPGAEGSLGTNIRVQRYGFGCAAIGPKLYVFGGFRESSTQQCAYSHQQLNTLQACDVGACVADGKRKGTTEKSRPMGLSGTSGPKLRWHNLAWMGDHRGTVLAEAVLAL